MGARPPGAPVLQGQGMAQALAGVVDCRSVGTEPQEGQAGARDHTRPVVEKPSWG